MGELGIVACLHGTLQWIAMLAFQMLAVGTFRKFYLGRRLQRPAFRGQQTHLAVNDKFLALGIHNGKGDSNLILVLQVKYYYFGEKFIAFQGINCRKLQHIPLVLRQRRTEGVEQFSGCCFHPQLDFCLEREVK